MTAAEIIAAAAAAGVALSVDAGGVIRARPSGALPEALRAAVKANKAALIDALQAHAEAIEERAAIAEHDGGLPKDWAEALTAIEARGKPANMLAAQWRSALDRIWARADEHGAAMHAAGWTFEEAFGLGENWFRLDQRGAAWLGDAAHIVAVTPAAIVFEHAGGRRLTHKKPARERRAS